MAVAAAVGQQATVSAALKTEPLLSTLQKKHDPSQFIHHLWYWLRDNTTKNSEKAEDDLIHIASNVQDVSGLLETIFISEKDKEQAKEENVLEEAQTNIELYGHLYGKYKDNRIEEIIQIILAYHLGRKAK